MSNPSCNSDHKKMIELKNSYIFVRHPDTPMIMTIFGQKAASFPVGIFIVKTFPMVELEHENESTHLRIYRFTKELDGTKFDVKLKLYSLENADFLDVIVRGPDKMLILEIIQNIEDQLMQSGLTKNYIDTIAYDSVSQYFCSKIFPKMGNLERNLRHLMFNIYIVNFGRKYFLINKYFKYGNKIEGRIGNNEDQEDVIQERYNIGQESVRYINYFQNYFYEFDFNDIIELMFTPNLTANERKKIPSLDNLDDKRVAEIYDEHSKSDWDRFFHDKISLENTKNILDRIRQYRNIAAHAKKFRKNDYSEALALITQMNNAVLEAITLTEEVDFAEKNKSAFDSIGSSLAERLAKLSEPTNNLQKAVREVSSSTRQLEDALAEKQAWTNKIIETIQENQLSNPFSLNIKQAIESTQTIDNQLINSSYDDAARKIRQAWEDSSNNQLILAINENKPFIPESTRAIMSALSDEMKRRQEFMRPLVSQQNKFQNMIKPMVDKRNELFAEFKGVYDNLSMIANQSIQNIYQVMPYQLMSENNLKPLLDRGDNQLLAIINERERFNQRKNLYRHLFSQIKNKTSFFRRMLVKITFRIKMTSS